MKKYNGIRKYIAILPTISLVNSYAMQIALNNKDTKYINLNFLRGLQKNDNELQEHVIESIVQHPNVGGALLVTNDLQSSINYKKKYKTYSKLINSISLLGSSGNKDFLSISKNIINNIKLEIKDLKINKINLKKICVALECGGSDQTSGIFNNPVIGMLVDYLIAQGSTVIISETAEFIGTEKIIKSSTKNISVSNKIIKAIKQKDNFMKKSGIDYRGINPTQENLKEGITTLVEKSLGAIKKAGGCNFSEYIDYASKPTKKGLIFMDTPFYTPVSFTGMMSAGSCINLLGMGSFNPSNNPIVPTLRICSNPHTIKKWNNIIDVDLSVYFKKANVDLAFNKLKEIFFETLNGRDTLSEKENSGEILIPYKSELL